MLQIWCLDISKRFYTFLIFSNFETYFKAMHWCNKIILLTDSKFCNLRWKNFLSCYHKHRMIISSIVQTLNFNWLLWKTVLCQLGQAIFLKPNYFTFWIEIFFNETWNQICILWYKSYSMKRAMLKDFAHQFLMVLNAIARDFMDLSIE